MFQTSKKVKMLTVVAIMAVLVGGLAVSAQSSNKYVPEISGGTNGYLIMSKQKVAPDPTNPILPTPSLPAASQANTYRGVIKQADNGKLLLEQVEGRNFGFAQMQIMLDNSTQYIDSNKAYKVGDYVEVTYGATTRSIPPQANAISIKKLSDPAMIVMNCEFVSNTKTDKGGSMTVKTLANPQTVIIHYSNDTVFVKPLSEIKAGDKLSVTTTGIMTMSLPGQTNAIEVAAYEKLA